MAPARVFLGCLWLSVSLVALYVAWSLGFGRVGPHFMVPGARDSSDLEVLMWAMFFFAATFHALRAKAEQTAPWINLAAAFLAVAGYAAILLYQELLGMFLGLLSVLLVLLSRRTSKKFRVFHFGPWYWPARLVVPALIMDENVAGFVAAGANLSLAIFSIYLAYFALTKPEGAFGLPDGR